MNQPGNIENFVENEQFVNAFVFRPIKVTAPLPYAFSSTVVLEKANTEDMQKLSDVFSRYQPRISQTLFARYNCDLIEMPAGNGGIGYHYKNLLEDEWRFYFVKVQGWGDEIDVLHQASNLTDTPFDLHSISFPSQGVGSRPVTFNKALQPNIVFPQIVDTKALEKIQAIFELLSNTQLLVDYPEIWRGIRMLDALDFLPDNSDFIVLGLFAIIEMLITHNPKLEDKGDSITHQMKTKIPLLAKRFEEPLNYEVFSANPSPDKIWAQLYGYRSSIAHGGSPDFGSKDYRHLKDRDVAIEFLKKTVKALLRHALKEPQLYRDLKEC